LKEKTETKRLIKRILAPIDGSEHANKALDYALDLANKYDAALTILNVKPTPVVPGYVPSMPGPAPVPPTWLGTYSKEVTSEHEKMLSEALEKAKRNKPALKISTKLVKGRPAKQIVETAKEGNFDIIVMGSRGLGGIKEFFLGSVSHRASNDAECPVLIVK
jgi:nucleotide-binding universal stress UspA family protein